MWGFSAVLGVLIIMQQPPIDHSPHKNSLRSHTTASDPSAPNLPSQVVQPTIVGSHNDGQNKAPTSEKGRGYWHEAFGPAYAANWALVGVGFAAGYLTWQTLRAIKRQAEIQAVGLKQWLDVRPAGGSRESTFVLGGLDYKGPLTIRFSASNPTLYPLTIKEVFLKVSRNGVEESKWEPFFKKEDVVLPPKKENISESEYPFFIVLEIDESMREDYNRSQFITSINGHAIFQPAMGPSEKYNFSWLIRWGPPLFMEIMPLGSELAKSETTPERLDLDEA